MSTESKGQGYYGSINYDKLLEGLRSGKLKTHKTDDGTRYVNINIYITETPNQYEQVGSVSVPLKKEFHTENEKCVYIANLKKSVPKETTAKDFPQQEDDNLPF